MPSRSDRSNAKRFDRALEGVADVLRAHYTPKHILFASLRAKDPHIHIHVFPVTDEQESLWRQEKGEGYATGRFFEFLGDQESKVRRRPLPVENLLTDVGRLRELVKLRQA